ncbi:uncharacterized protein F4822DRAFT_435289 [Hypoxylon trugodes]|uniref:uncharacterized protein n=1 Tax=Hypoxylon trugodes TaxID=326681 RepID=UPI00219BDB52|nr:uncharacterized protein F4822DRAFT_435289 [Hypoxylon trugodes]KAI1382613.1 hypothetical protein F4822DRAFT_435289 [Hypoxylon trugodes]
MPTLVQSSPLWTSYGELNNEEIEGLIIESQHLTELLQAELRLRGAGVAEDFIQGRDVRRKAENIQKYGLTSSDRELIADANHLGMAVIRGGLNSAKHGLTQWKHISYTKLIWLVANVTTSAHALLLVIALGKNRLEKINLMERSRLVSFIKQHETTLLCPCLVPVARLPVDSLDSIATSSRFSHENLCED